MTCTIRNRVPRAVSFRGNSGQVWHLPPGIALDVAEVEVTDNPKVQKLARQGVIAVEEAESSDTATSGPEKPRKTKPRASER